MIVAPTDACCTPCGRDPEGARSRARGLLQRRPEMISSKQQPMLAARPAGVILKGGLLRAGLGAVLGELRRDSLRECARIFAWIDGVSCNSRWKAWAVITSRRTGLVATTDAVRGVSVTSAISPKKSPACIVRSLRPLRRASTVPSTSTKNSRPLAPSSIRVVPSG